MDKQERDRIEALARRTALEVLHSATLGTGELSQLAVARAISEAIAAVMADHDYRYLHLQGNDAPLPAVMGLSRDRSDTRVDIIVNGQHKTVTKPTLSYGDVLSLTELMHGTVATVTYRCRSTGIAPCAIEGSLNPGQSVAVDDGMVFNAVVTNNN